MARDTGLDGGVSERERCLILEFWKGFYNNLLAKFTALNMQALNVKD